MPIKPLDSWPWRWPVLIAGPCSAESFSQVIETAKALKELNIPDLKIFRAGIWKPRTRPNTFEGIGIEGLSWLAEVKKETGLLVATEVANTKHTEAALKAGIDVLWIGARTTSGPFAVQEIADVLKGSDIPVFVKNPVGPDLATWIGAIERFTNVGLTKVAAIHRGFTHLGGITYRNDPVWKMAIDLKSKMPSLPIICDPSHIAGKRNLIAQVCQKALDIDVDGLMIETHLAPDKAMSDSEQQITPSALGALFKNLSFKSESAKDPSFDAGLDQLRAKIDRIDREIIESLLMRQKIIQDIGEQKKTKNITALQKSRVQELLTDRINLAKKLGLSPDYIEDIFHSIHAESVRLQTEIMKKKS